MSQLKARHEPETRIKYYCKICWRNAECAFPWGVLQDVTRTELIKKINSVHHTNGCATPDCVIVLINEKKAGTK